MWLLLFSMVNDAQKVLHFILDAVERVSVTSHTSRFGSTVLLWCDQGTATVNAPDRVVAVMAGDIVVAPVGAFVSGHGVVLPITFPDFPFQGNTRRIHLGSRWSHRMVYEFARSLMGEKDLSPEIASLFSERACPPPAPQAGAAKMVAQLLVANPADQTSLVSFAQRFHVSSRTLQRQFLQGTGFTFSEWRAAHRVSVAATLLPHDFTISVVANLVGFSATSSLTRAFRRHTGLTPSAFTGSATGMGSVGEPPHIPATTTFARAEQDLALWIYKGTATVTTPGYCRFVGMGETVTIPSGTHTRVDVAAGSIALPIPLAHANEGLTLMDALKHCLNPATTAELRPLAANERVAAEKLLIPSP